MQVTQLEKEIIEYIQTLNGDFKHSAISAFRHLDRAEKLQADMPEVAVFLAITAEEEAATAVFKLLKSKQYDGAKRLKPYVHAYKAGLSPFVDWMKAELTPPVPLDLIDLIFSSDGFKDNKPRLRIRYKLEFKGKEPIAAMPHPPLDMRYRDSNGNVVDFSPKIRAAARDEGIECILSEFKALGNLRNKVLYASATQLPSVDDAETLVSKYRNSTFKLLKLMLFIEPYKHQEVVIEGIRCFNEVMTSVSGQTDS